VLLTSSSLKMKKVSSLLWPRHRSRAREDFSSVVASTSLEGEEGLSYMCWVSTLDERPAECEVISSPACLNTWDKVTLWCPRPRRGLLQQRRIVLGVSKHQRQLSPYLCALGATPEERPARRQHIFVPGVSKNTKAIGVLGAHARGEAC